ncbi:MAG TPA: rod shape-determining protein MreD [Candidatus Bacteroides avicola]|uniref:Rod shape-determining protein MreD n=1 Tax=Candidatus Bacteroides avicola TaxID=2838468 RepID=A0A9D2KVT4_9BACE|nr:rod shape-determining protein MreD [Mediterranea sp. An20]MBW9201927.1 rod shape-determining protein MreD [Bacteroidales bacterium SW292]OUP12081.1 rod shape-determining protein MreD [Mediterranea sp. An20]HJA86732.1 rod shape-determining protein MreD [Candidatus Bacteroides avicola]
MLQDYLHKIEWFIGLVLLQVLILNNVHIDGYATPFLYIYFIMKMDSDTPRNALLLWAFFLGLVIDIYSDTPGMNAAATVLLAFLRPLLLRLFVPRDMTDLFVPAIRTMGMAPFLKYITACVLLHHGVLLCIEFFSTAHPLALLLRIVSGALLTLCCILALEGIRTQRNP